MAGYHLRNGQSARQTSQNGHGRGNRHLRCRGLARLRTRRLQRDPNRRPRRAVRDSHMVALAMVAIVPRFGCRLIYVDSASPAGNAIRTQNVPRPGDGSPTRHASRRGRLPAWMSESDCCALRSSRRCPGWQRRRKKMKGVSRDMKLRTYRWRRLGIRLIVLGLCIGLFGTIAAMLGTFRDISAVDGSATRNPDVRPAVNNAVWWTSVGAVVSCIGLGLFVAAPRSTLSKADPSWTSPNENDVVR